MDWRMAVKQMLIQGGMNGIKQSHFTAELKRHVTAEELLEELEALRTRGVVDKYVLRRNKRGAPTTIWRANRNIVGETK